MASYKNFIQENTAPMGVKRIGIYNEQGNRTGYVLLGNLMKEKGQKLYSFGALSDVHVQYETGVSDFQKALGYLNNTEDVEFTCICGDLTSNGTDSELTTYKDLVNGYSPNTPVYAVFGNHDTYQGLHNTTEAYTGFPLCYTVTRGNDVFIMVGISSGEEGTIFANGQLQWLYEQLEANRNKRCFLFEHVPPVECSGDVLGIYPYTKLRNSTEALVFKSLLKHYHNVVFFHGHTHMKFYLQEYGDIANYDKIFGCHTVHIPSLAVPRDTNNSGGYTNVYAASEGYVVDVYDKGIHLRGRDFVKEEFIPIASYWIDTTLIEIEAKTYKDSTGTITT